MTARTIANRLLEADEDFNVHGELERLTTSGFPGYEIESEGQHWNVYKKAPEGVRVASHNTPMGTGGYHAFIGEITYDDMANMPKETMTPENIAYWNTHRWFASAGFRDNERQMCRSFEDAVRWIIAVNAVKTAPLREADDPDDPSTNIERFARERSTPVEMRFINHNQRPFRVKLVFDEPSHGTSYDAKGKPEPPTYHPTVQFYDMTHADAPAKTSFKDKGQFVSSYYAATLMEHPRGGLDLHGGEQAWQIDGHSMDQVRVWIKQEVEGRGYKLKNELFGMQYESEDPDDPDIYTHPERYTQQPSEEKIESLLRRKLAPYYPDIRISKRPGMFQTMNRETGFKDNFIWTIHCQRETSLPLPTGYANVLKYGQQIDWREQAQKWFTDWAQECGLSIFKFEIFGRLRKDPTIQFETARLGPLKESEEEPSPEVMLAHYADTTDWHTDMYNALWRFHPYGVGYDVIDLGRGAFIVARTYFPPEKDDFATRFRDFVQQWFEKKRIFPVKFMKLYSFPHAHAAKNYPEWSTIATVNAAWPDTSLPEYRSTVEVGKSPLPGEADTPQV